MAVASAMATATVMSTSSCASDSSKSGSKDCGCACPSLVTEVLAASWRVVQAVLLGAWAAKLPSAPVAGDEEALAWCGAAA